ncbi:3753_t:CDS:2, partial [Paraglomus occultum]
LAQATQFDTNSYAISQQAASEDGFGDYLSDIDNDNNNYNGLLREVMGRMIISGLAWFWRLLEITTRWCGWRKKYPRWSKAEKE